MSSAQTADVDTSLGRFTWMGKRFNLEWFLPRSPVLGSKPKLFHFGQRIMASQVISAMSREGYRPATLDELVDYGKGNVEEYRKHHIAALGSVARCPEGDRVVYIAQHVSRNCLYTHALDGIWSDDYRFLGVLE